MTSRISIVTISYNQAPFLEECIRSVIDQDADHIEYIVVDPGSTDGSRDIINRYRDRIDHILFEPDSGPADGLNKGFALATGDVFGYINADDRYLPGALGYVQRYFGSRPDIDVLNGAIRIIDGEGRASPRKRTADHFDVTRYAAGLCMVGQQATFFRREAFTRAGGFNLSNRVAWDGELLVDMALAGARFEPVAKVLGDWRLYGANITGSADFHRNLKAYFSGVKRKLAARSIPIYSPVQERIATLFYKLNVARHLRYLTVSA